MDIPQVYLTEAAIRRACEQAWGTGHPDVIRARHAVDMVAGCWLCQNDPGHVWWVRWGAVRCKLTTLVRGRVHTHFLTRERR